MPDSRDKASRWINVALVVAFLLAPVAWYVAAIHGPPLRHSEHDIYPTSVFVGKGEGGRYYVCSDESSLVVTSTAGNFLECIKYRQTWLR